jgi:hypothetical protein
MLNERMVPLLITLSSSIFPSIIFALVSIFFQAGLTVFRGFALSDIMKPCHYPDGDI